MIVVAGGGGGGGVLEISVLGEVRVVVVSIICFVTLPTIHTCLSGCPRPCSILPGLGFLLLSSTSFTFVQTLLPPRWVSVSDS